jgi:hypothetical protein
MAALEGVVKSRSRVSLKGTTPLTDPCQFDILLCVLAGRGILSR